MTTGESQGTIYTENKKKSERTLPTCQQIAPSSERKCIRRSGCGLAWTKSAAHRTIVGERSEEATEGFRSAKCGGGTGCAGCMMHDA
jgi:hypothetical protein